MKIPTEWYRETSVKSCREHAMIQWLVMNAFGVRGWDLVRVLVIGERMEYIFKRPKIQRNN